MVVQTPLKTVYSTDASRIEWPLLYALYQKVGLAENFGRRNPYDALLKAFNNSYKVVTAWVDDDLLVGAGRMISDGVCYGTVCDVGVDPNYRRIGIGRGIVQKLLEGEEEMSVSLSCPTEYIAFYKSLGFLPHKNVLGRSPRKHPLLDYTDVPKNEDF